MHWCAILLEMMRAGFRRMSEQEESFIALLAEKLAAFLHSIGYPPFRIGVGTPCRNPLYIKHSFYEADAAASSIDSNVPNNIAFYRTDKESSGADLY